MKAELLMRERLILSRRAFVEIVIWKLPKPLPDRLVATARDTERPDDLVKNTATAFARSQPATDRPWR
jgi:hypothetical protein